MDYILKNKFLPLTKGEIERKQKDPNFKRLPDKIKKKIRICYYK